MSNRNDPLEDFAKMVWGKRAEGLPVAGFDLSRAVSAQEIENLLQKYAFVQILRPGAPAEFVNIRFMRSRSGWIILNYKDAMAASPGEQLFQEGNYIFSEQKELERVCSGVGTRIKQIVDTAADMVRIAKEEENWPEIHIVNGHPQMMWGIWKAAQDMNIPVSGYVPSTAEEAKYLRIQRLMSDVPSFPKP